MASSVSRLIDQFSKLQKGGNRNDRPLNKHHGRAHAFVEHPAWDDELNLILLSIELHLYHYSWLSRIARLANNDDAPIKERMKPIRDPSCTEFMGSVRTRCARHVRPITTSTCLSRR